jgi:PAS domain S-box-containing protein
MGNNLDPHSEPASRKTILLVEDEAIVAADEAGRLTDEGYVVLHAASGEEAIKMVRAARPDGIDIILMDINLGKGMDGTRAAKEILKERDIPIIFLSSHTEKAIVDRTEKIAFYGYVVKDSVVTVLSASIKMAFKLHESHRELVKQEAALHEMSETFRLFMEYNPIYVFIKDDRIRPVYLSRNYEKLLGRPLSELLGKSMDELFPSELSKSMIADDLRILRERKPVDNIIEVMGGRTYSTLKFPILIDGAPKYLAGYTIDITDRRRAEEEVKNAQLLLKSSIESPKEMIILSIDRRHRYLYFNQWHKQVMRAAYGKDVRIGMNILECITSEDDRQKAKRNYDRALAGESHSTVEEYGDAERSFYESFYSPIIDENGEIIGATAFARNVTGRKRSEEALRESVRQKEILMKELQHRVKNSLAAVSGLLGLGMETLTDERSRGIFADTRSRIRSIASLYEQLSGTSDAAHVDLGRYFERLAESLFKTYAPGTGDILLKTRLDDIKLETKRAVPLGLILNELVMNSVKYAYPPGAKGEIRVDLTRSGDGITLGVSDDGLGLPEGFDPKTSGGMGWSLVRMLTEEIDGELTCPAGAPGPGTRVLIRFKP